MVEPTILLDNASATGAEKVITRSGSYCFSVVGTFGGATVTLQRRAANAVWLSVGADAALTAAGQVIVDLPPGSVRALVAGGSPSALYAQLEAF